MFGLFGLFGYVVVLFCGQCPIAQCQFLARFQLIDAKRNACTLLLIIARRVRLTRYEVVCAM